MPKATWGNIEGSPWEDELDDYPVYEGDLPPKGVYRCVMKFLRLKTNRNGDPMLNGLLIINEPKGSKKAQYNGYDFWFNLNVTSQGSRWVNNFLAALVPETKVAATRKAFWAQKVMLDKADPPNVVSIGAVKIVENMVISAQCGVKTYDGDTSLDAKRFLRPSDTAVNEEGLPSADEDEEGWEDEEGAEEPEDEAGEEDEDEEFNARVDELEGMDRKALLAAAKEAGVSVKRGTPESKIIDAILAEEFPEEDEDEEDEEDEEAEDEDLEEEETAEEEPEEEPAPPKRTRRTAAKPAAKKPAPPAKKEEQARTRTGTRRRRAGSGEPPF